MIEFSGEEIPSSIVWGTGEATLPSPDKEKKLIGRMEPIAVDALDRRCNGDGPTVKAMAAARRRSNTAQEPPCLSPLQITAYTACKFLHLPHQVGVACMHNASCISWWMAILASGCTQQLDDVSCGSPATSGGCRIMQTHVLAPGGCGLKCFASQSTGIFCVVLQ
jgi:hypothetical protein